MVTLTDAPMKAAVLAVMLVGGTAVQPQHSTPPLRNAADPGVTMPFAGLGMPCGPTYTCKQSSYEGTLTFLALGGRHTDSADSYTGAEPGIGLAMREWMASDPAANRRADLFIGSKIGPGGACWPLGYKESINQAKMILGYYNSLSPRLAGPKHHTSGPAAGHRSTVVATAVAVGRTC